MKPRMRADNSSDLRGVKAEAAMWLVKLHSPERDSDMEAGFMQWLAESPEHASAFERATTVWEQTGNLSSGLPSRDE